MIKRIVWMSWKDGQNPLAGGAEKVNEEIKHYEDAIVKKKPGRKVQDLVQKFDTPKKK